MRKVQSHMAKVDSKHLNYYQVGNGPWLLFLHGSRVDALTFKKFITLLAQHYTVIAPDIPGYGASFTPDEKMVI